MKTTQKVATTSMPLLQRYRPAVAKDEGGADTRLLLRVADTDTVANPGHTLGGGLCAVIAMCASEGRHCPTDCQVLAPSSRRGWRL